MTDFDHFITTETSDRTFVMFLIGAILLIVTLVVFLILLLVEYGAAALVFLFNHIEIAIQIIVIVALIFMSPVLIGYVNYRRRLRNEQRD